MAVGSDMTRAVVLDADGLSKAVADDKRVISFLDAAVENDLPVVVSAVTLAETLRGRPADARVHRLLSSAQVRPVTAEIGRAAGELLGSTGRSDTVDAVVAVTAEAVTRRFGDVYVLTGDPSDLTALTETFEGVTVIAV